MWSDIFFNLGYASRWIGLFAAVRRKPLHLVVTFLFHVVTTLVVITTTVAYFYLLGHGTTLDYGTVAEWIPRFEEIQPILVYEVPTSAWMPLAAALFYATLGPMIVTRVVERRRSPEDGGFSTVPSETSFLGSLGLCTPYLRAKGLRCSYSDHTCPRSCSGGFGGTRRTCDGPARLPVAAVATTTNASTVADSRDHLVEGFNDMLLMLIEQLETRDEEEGSVLSYGASRPAAAARNASTA